jgi:hypothetical protein
LDGYDKYQDRIKEWEGRRRKAIGEIYFITITTNYTLGAIVS